jgi:hypothetical protein
MDEFVHPLTGRYASRAMRRLFSPATRFGLWRRLWLELMKAERELGVAIPAEAIAELERRLEPTPAELARADELERETRHDVMAHVRALAEVAPAAGPWLHLGATSCYVTDNADLIVLREAADLVLGRAAGVVAALASFASTHRALPCLGHTHFQPAQPTTVGKRATLWLFDLLLDLDRLGFERDRLLLRGAKGTTGTQASFLQLLGSDKKVRELDRRIAGAFGFPGSYPVTGQTSPRKPEFYLLGALSGLARRRTSRQRRASLSPQELDEPAIHPGRPAMQYANPMRCERSAARPLPDLARGQRRLGLGVAVARAHRRPAVACAARGSRGRRRTRCGAPSALVSTRRWCATHLTRSCRSWRPRRSCSPRRRASATARPCTSGCACCRARRPGPSRRRGAPTRCSSWSSASPRSASTATRSPRCSTRHASSAARPPRSTSSSPRR